MSIQFTITDNDNTEFQRLYAELDDIDLPRDVYVDLNAADNSNEQTTNNARMIRPLTPTRVENDTRGAISMSESFRLQIRKRGLSFFHGAMLTIDAHITNTGDKALARSRVIELYNNFEVNNQFQNTWSIESFAKKLNVILSAYDITSKDILAGEKVANLDRKRPTVLMSQSEYGLINESPLPSHMNHQDIKAQYDFILNATSGLRSKIHGDYSRENRQDMLWLNKKWVITQKLLKIAASIGTIFAKYNLDTKPVFSWFSDIAQRVQHAKQAKEALATAKAPQWFKKHTPVIQDFLLHHAGDPDLPAIPPTLRDVPGLPNMTLHESHFDDENNVIFSNFVIRHGTLTPYGITNATERKKAAYANGKALGDIVEDKARKAFDSFWTESARNSLNFKNFKIPTADLSFMSPYPGMHKIGKVKKTSIEKIQKIKKGQSEITLFHERPDGFKEDNHAMKRENREAYQYGMTDRPGFNPSCINLGINGDRWYVSKTFESEQYQDQVTETLDTFETLKINVAALNATKKSPFNTRENENKFELACKAAQALEYMNDDFNQSYLSSAFTRAKTRSRLINAELFASCLYAIIIQGMGGTVSATCKSSKDRTGLFLLHLDAMYAYASKNKGELISYKALPDSPERKAFIEIMADLYIDHVQQTMASQATYGATGLKEPNGLATYLGSSMGPLPADLEEAVNRKAPNLFTIQKELAGLNKLKI